MDDGMGDEKIWTNDQIKVPVLAVMAQSPAWKPDEEQFFRSIAPNLEFQMWTGVSHFLMMDRPKEFNEAVSKFIANKKLL
jgi:pimeloyl-ACP methyl ester carboxylesterase